MNFTRKEFIKILGTGSIAAYLGSKLPAAITHESITPQVLSRGDTIGMISPASSLPEYLSYGKIVEKIKNLGFKVKVGEHAKNQYGYFAGTDKNRAEDLNAMFADPKVDGIIPFRGGWGCNRILEHIDFDLIADNPKPLIGFSDITSLLLSILAKTGLVTYHGPVGKSHWTDYTKTHFRKALMQTDPFITRNRRSHIKTITGGKATGKLLGGNLTVLTAMFGSSYLPKWEGSILFVEEVGEEVYRIDRMLTQLRLAGTFEKINGFIFGQCVNCEAEPGPHFTLKEVVNQHLAEFNIPAYMGANIGHIDDMITLPVGVEAEIDADEGSIQLLEPPVVNKQKNKL